MNVNVFSRFFCAFFYGFSNPLSMSILYSEKKIGFNHIRQLNRPSPGKFPLPFIQCKKISQDEPRYIKTGPV
jgi:hypothetical protein